MARLPSLIAALALALATSAHAQSWPNKPTRILVPFAAGGNTDALARILADQFARTFGQSFVVENRVGAHGTIAADAVAKAAPDGYTLLVCAAAQITIVPQMGKVPYDPVRDFTPISNIGTNPFVLGIPRKLPATNLREFVDHVKARPDQYAYASGGAGSTSHLSAAWLVARAGLRMTHVPYKGGAPAVKDLLGGQVQMYFGNFSDVVPHKDGPNIMAIGVSSEKRHPTLPEVPAVAEVFPGFRTVTWNGLFGPAGMPREVVERLAAEVVRITKDPVNIERFAKLGVDPAGSTPQAFVEWIRADFPVWKEAVAASGAKLE